MHNSCKSHTTITQSWSLICNIACNGHRGIYFLLSHDIQYVVISLNPIKHDGKGMKTNSLLPVHTHTGAHNTKNEHTNTHAGSCSHRAQYQSKSPFTHRPSNTDGSTFPEKVRDLACSHDHQLHPSDWQSWKRSSVKATACFTWRVVQNAT